MNSKRNQGDSSTCPNIKTYIIYINYAFTEKYTYTLRLHTTCKVKFRVEYTYTCQNFDVHTDVYIYIIMHVQFLKQIHNHLDRYLYLRILLHIYIYMRTRVCTSTRTHIYIYAYFLTDWPTGWLIGYLVNWLIGWLIDWLADWLIVWDMYNYVYTHVCRYACIQMILNVHMCIGIHVCEFEIFK